ncbi:ATP-binding protein (plasmid) [Rhizobium sophoriradicis]|uniref:ATP-binding protein n=1 Tax=Rhizobium sophoriradicis TaxID=1535245 RepID=UPI00160F63C4|nr:ATP-binding protein [Rhizobium leguminosarum bv. phaseoli]
MTIRPRTRSRGKAVPAPLIGSFLLESITTGMYGERKNAIREYVQNSYDGIQAAIEGKVLRAGAGKVTLTLSPDAKTLVILDNGVGLPYRVAVNTLTAVGASRKERGREAGFRGIGRLAGIAFCKTLRFRTKAAGDDVETIVEFDCDKLREGMLSSGRKPAAELITACTTYDQPDVADDRAHYFEVSLIGLKNAPAEATDPLQLRTFLSQVAPVDFHPDFKAYRDQILEQVEGLVTPDLQEPPEEEDDELPDWSVLEDESGTMLERIPFSYVSVVIRGGAAGREEQVFKPYRQKLGVADSDNVPLRDVTVHTGESGAWWGWIGHKTKPGEYQEDAVSGLRFRLKNIQIDGNELITLVPTTNEIRSAFRWSNWFIGEIHIDPRAVVPNARRDNFEEDPRWLAIRKELDEVCQDLTAEARRVSKEHQTSVEVLSDKAEKLRTNYLKAVNSRTYDVKKAEKILRDSDALQKDIEKASLGAPSTEQLRLKSLTKEITQIRVGLLEQPKTPEYERFRAAIKAEFLKVTLSVLNRYLDIDVYEDVKDELERRLK